MLSVVKSARRFLKPILPPWAHKALRVAWYSLVLPPVRLYSRLREFLGGDYSAAPPAHILAQYGMSNPSAFARTGGKKLAMIQHHLGELGIEISLQARILDFGCGSARALCAFHNHYPKASCYGCDVKTDVIQWANKYRPDLTVIRNDFSPPLPDDFRDFDFIYSLSVWTHMPEASCSAWLKHMHERMKPGGILFLTIADTSTQAVRHHGFDSDTLGARVRANEGCLYDAGTDMTYIQKEWVEREIEGLFCLRYFGPAIGHWQLAVVLERMQTARTPN